MNIFNHFLSDLEKQIFENHFIYEAKDSKIKFQKCASEIINRYSNEKVNLDEKWKNSNSLDYGINLIWDKENNINALNYFLAHPKFKLSKVKIKHFKLFNKNLNIVNDKGETPLIILAKHYISTSDLLELINKPLGFDFSIRDDSNKDFYISFFENYANTLKISHKINYSTMGFVMLINNFQKILSYWMENYKGKENIENILIVSSGLIETSNIVKDIAKENNLLSKRLMRTNIENIERIAHVLELEATMSVNNKVNRKIKI